MLEFICLFFPTVICVYFTERFLKKSFSGKSFIYLFCSECLAVNGLVFVFKALILKSAVAPLSELSGMTVQAALNYIIMAVSAAFLVAFSINVWKYHIRLKIVKETTTNEEKNTNE